MNWRWRRCRRISADSPDARVEGRASRFSAGEPDRWRNVGDLPLKNFNGPDHYIDLEDLKLYDLTPETLPIMRYDFAADIAQARAAHPERFPPIDPAKDADHTRELGGFLPWAITENYEKLKSVFQLPEDLPEIRRHAGGNRQRAGGLSFMSWA